MVKTGIGALIFALIFGIIFGFSAYLFISVIAGLDLSEAGIFAGPAAALGGLLIFISGGAAALSGLITIILLISGFSNLKRYIKYKNSNNY